MYESQKQSIQQICELTHLHCTGQNIQWASINDCVFTLSQKPFGDYNEA